MSVRGLQALIAQQIAVREGETVTYRFKSGDPDRTFKAVVKREFLEPSSPQGRAVKTRMCTVEVPRHRTCGVMEWRSGDLIILPVGIGEPAVECRVMGPPIQDHAQLIMRVREQ